MPRPTLFNEQIADTICERLIQGMSLREICSDESLPCERTIYRWLQDDRGGFCQQYTHAREIQAEMLADEILEIADDSRNDYVERRKKDGTTYLAVDHEAIQRSHLRIEARKWIAAKLLPKKYGSFRRHEHAGPEGTPIAIKEKTSQELAARAIALNIPPDMLPPELRDIAMAMLAASA